MPRERACKGHRGGDRRVSINAFEPASLPCADSLSNPQVENDGFHAATDPYCKKAVPRILPQQYITREYKCMVCGQTA